MGGHLKAHATCSFCHSASKLVWMSFHVSAESSFGSLSKRPIETQRKPPNSMKCIDNSNHHQASQKLGHGFCKGAHPPA